MHVPYDPRAFWCWCADDGRVFKAPACVLVDKTDTEFEAFVAALGYTPAWPYETRDPKTGTLSGQTDAALDAVLAPYGLSTTPSNPLSVYAASALTAKFAAGETFNVAASGSTALPILCDGTNSTRADLALLALFGQQNPSGTKTWIDNKGVATVLTGAQLVNLSTLAGNWISDCYPALATVLAGIASGKVTTTSAIDSAFAAVTA